VAGIFAAAAILLVGSAELIVQAGEPQMAVRSVAAVGMAADAILGAGDGGPGGKELALAAIRRSPAHPAALRLLAQQEQDPLKARRLMAAASAWGWREPGTRMALFLGALRAGDAKGAVIQADALLRQGEGGRPVIALLWQRSRSVEFRRALADRLRYRPGWRADFLSSTYASVDAAPGLTGELRRTGAPLTRSEGGALLTTLVLEGGAPAASEIWKAQFARHLAQGDDAAWPDGDAVGTPTPFDWKFSRSAAALVKVEPRQVRVTAAPSLQGIFAERLFSLPAGRYRFHLAQPAAAAGVAVDWSAGCTGAGYGNIRALGEDILVPGGCEAVRLQVSLRVDPSLAPAEFVLDAPRLERLP
jgi:hypothetical protein